MVLPTNCDEAPRLTPNLQPCLCKWVSAASTVWAMGSIPANCSFNSWKCWWIQSVLLFVCQDGWCPSCRSSERLVAFSTHASLCTRPCLHTSNPQTQLGARVRQQLPMGGWHNGQGVHKLYRWCSIIERTEVIQLDLPGISGPRSAPSRESNPEYRLSIKKLPAPNPSTCLPCETQ